MPVVWPTILDLGRDECKRILRKLGKYSPQNATELKSAELSTMNASTPSLIIVVCYSFTSTTCTPTNVSAVGAAAVGVAVKSPRPPSPSSNVVVLPSGSTVYVKSVSCSDEDEKPRKRRRTNSSSSSPVMLKEVTKVSPQVSKNITVPINSSPKMSNIMQSIANSLPPHLSPVKITFTKPTIQTTSTATQKVIIVTTSPSSNFVPNILSKSQNNATVSKLGSASILSTPNQKQAVVLTASTSPCSTATAIAVTTVVSSTPSVVMSTATCASAAGLKVASARLPSPKTLVGSPAQILAQFPKQQSPKHLQQSAPLGASSVSQTHTTSTSPVSKPTIQIKQESGVKIITQQVQPSKILPKPSSVALSSSSSSPIMVVSSNGAIMTTKLVTQPTATQATYTRPTVSPIGARISASSGGTTYVKTTSGSIITVVPKSLATLGGKIISSNIVSGTTTKITTIPVTSKPNVIVVQKTTGKGTTIQGLPGKNVVTTLLNTGVSPTLLCLIFYSFYFCRDISFHSCFFLWKCSISPQGEKGLQAVQGTKPAIITASRPITKMIVTQPKSMSSGSQSTATKIIPTKIVYGQQGKTQVLIKPKPVFQAAVVSEQTRQLVTETLQQVTRAADQGQAASADGSGKEESGSSGGDGSHGSAQDPQPVVHVVSSREQDWPEQDVAIASSPTIIYQEVSAGESQSATSTIKALLELQQTVKEKAEPKPRQHTIDLSQMVVPIQLTQDKRPNPESPKPSTSEAEASTECIPATACVSPNSPCTGKINRAGVSSEDHDLILSSSSQQPIKSFKGSSQIVMVTKPAAASSADSHISLVPSDKPDTVLEVSDVEGDTLDPQTGLFYRSGQSAADPVKHSPTQGGPQSVPLSQTEAVQSSPPMQPRPPQLHSKPQISQPSSSSSSASLPATPPLTKKLPKLREQNQPKPQTVTQILKERPLPAAGQTGPKVALPGAPSKPPLTPQLPKLQQAPTSHHRPLHTPMSQPPPLQAHHPVSTEKTASSQPIITQSATVTKITFGGPHRSPPAFSSAEATAKLLPESTSGPPGEKPSVSDILKISMMEAEIDPSTEPMVVDSSSDCDPLGKTLEVQAVSGTLDSGQFISSSGVSIHHSHTKSRQFGCVEGLAAQSSKDDLEVIEVRPGFIVPTPTVSSIRTDPSLISHAQVIPQYAILPDSSQSNVVVEPSGFLEITNYTSQQLEDDIPMEQEVDSSNDEAAAASPPDQS
ncbi:unnamed protein product [Tetraodon nigroviridis]|uniref:(spotted green pufferfish) hypothetical protein n=1 Tax=Tetraodon nigroviridis TaxID=99883 RepID=Q4SEN5_TETNG|nr:unnamed protein product [Tetraodon nigroviridis]